MYFVRKTNDEFISELNDKNIIYTPLEEYCGHNQKIEWKCPKCGNNFHASPSNILKGRGCSYCGKNSKNILVGYNDMWTTNPFLASMLLDKNNGYKYKEHSKANVDWICPNCGRYVYSKRISYVNKNGVPCPNCSDGISYPEKFISNMLNQLNVEFEHDVSFEWSANKRYDFYIKNLSIIIEAHGMQHYEDGFIKIGGKSAKEQEENDCVKKNIALENGILKYVQLDCRKSNKEHIRRAVLDSELSRIFDLSNIDWKQCDVNATYHSMLSEACMLWEKHGDTSVVSELLGVSRGTAIRYLQKGNDIGLCKYDSKKNNSATHSKSAICIETQKVYSPIKSSEKDGFNPKCVSNCCNGMQSMHKGLHFRFYDEEEVCLLNVG